MPDFLPRQERQLLSWSRAFNNGISAAPESLGLTQQQAADFDVAHTAMAYMIHQATSNETRTSVVVLQKNESVAALKSLARTLARIVRANPGVSASQRVELGLNAGIGTSTPIHAPAAAPWVWIESVIGQRVTIRLDNRGEPSRRGIPRGTIGAAVFACVSETSPDSGAFWQPQGYTSTYRMTIEFGANVKPGAQVWLAAQWLSPRLKPGPMSNMAATRVQGGVVAGQSLKFAA